MSLFGALFAGVSGLSGQSTKIAIISDNIANVNTVGYKQGQTQFRTLVTDSGSQFAYSPGGVLAGRRTQVDKQGLIQGSDAPTDVAVSGAGLFVVNTQVDGSGRPLFTRAGSFRQDQLGSFVNAAGFYLQAWPLDREGNLPSEPGIDSLETVNVESASGVAAVTTTVALGANLDAGQAVFPGAGTTITMDIASVNNFNINSNQIIVSDDYGAAPTNGIVRGDQLTVETGGTGLNTFTYGGFAVSRSVISGAAGDSATAAPGGGTGNILDATSATGPFLGVTGISGFTSASLGFTITSSTAGTVTFTYTTSSPNAQAGQFNNLTNLATAIDTVDGFAARVVAGRLYVSAEDADEALTFANVDDVGTLIPALSGIDWVDELGIADVIAGSNRFATLDGLADQVNTAAGISAKVNNPFGQASLDIFVDDPLDTISFYDGDDNDVTVVTNTGSLIDEFGLASATGYVAGAGVENSVANLGPAYDAGGQNGGNMASGDITSQFSRNVRIFDALGAGHELRMSFLKIGVNTWAVEVHSIPPEDVVTSGPNGQVAAGTINFNGDGSLLSVNNLDSEIQISWANQAIASGITIDWGSAGAVGVGLTDGLSQFASDYNVAFVNQNGSPVGQLVSVAISADGVITASYTNGETQKLYKIPLADFNNPNGLESLSGNAYGLTNESGELNLREPGSNGVGTIIPSALETSNVDLAEQLTDMIVAQRGFQANTRVISTTAELLQALTQL